MSYIGVTIRIGYNNHVIQVNSCKKKKKLILHLDSENIKKKIKKMKENKIKRKIKNMFELNKLIIYILSYSFYLFIFIIQRLRNLIIYKI